MTSNKISTAELRAALDAILRNLEASGLSEIEILEDYYWDVPQENRYEAYDQPKQLDVGQLADDVTEVKRIARGQAPPYGLGLIWLGAVLRRIGETSSV